MSVDIGIIGLPKSGRTTIFNCLTGEEADTTRYSQDSSTNVGTARVPEPRLSLLADMLKTDKIVPVSASYTDIGASVKDMALDKGIGGQMLVKLGQVNALINVVRAFEDETLPHIEGSLNVDRDIANMNLELVFSDMALLERRQERISESLKGAKPQEKSVLQREQEIVNRIKDSLEKDIPVRELELPPEEIKYLSGYQLLSEKPLLIVVNIRENQIPEIETIATGLNSRYSRKNCRITAICGELEMELSRLDEDAAAELRKEYGIKDSGVDLIVRNSYELLGLITFFTTASAEVKAWSVPGGTEALKAAGKIHSDMEKGFIRAEVIGYEELVNCGSYAEAKKRGLLRLEGKNYTVKDGDVITFLFNI